MISLVLLVVMQAASSVQKCTPILLDQAKQGKIYVESCEDKLERFVPAQEIYVDESWGIIPFEHNNAQAYIMGEHYTWKCANPTRLLIKRREDEKPFCWKMTGEYHENH